MNKPARKGQFVEPIQQIHPTGKSLLFIRNGVKPLYKNISVYQKLKSGYINSHPVPFKGARNLVANLGRNAPRDREAASVV
jgi:hypothetical protein